MACITLLWFIFSLIFPPASIKSIARSLYGNSTTTKVKVVTNDSETDWLPAPKNYRGLFGTSSSPTVTTNLYVAPKPYDGSAHTYYGTVANGGTTTGQNYSQYSYVIYTSSGGMVQKNDGTMVPFSSSTTAGGASVNVVEKPDGDLRRLYVRNLSIYEKGTLYKNLAFTGEARESMFDKSGKFRLVIIDNKGAIGVIGMAQASSDWAIHGWVRFSAVVQATLPKNVPCTLVLESGSIQPSTQKPLRFPFAMICTN
jgi:hypothetical protein